MTLADFKPPKRIRDSTVYEQFHAIFDTCLVCGHSPVTAAHLLRGKNREDVLEGLIPLCGHGSARCHGAFDSGHSYIGDGGRRVTPELVKASVGRFLRSPAGEDHCSYLLSRLGPFAAENYVLRLEGRI